MKRFRLISLLLLSSLAAAISWPQPYATAIGMNHDHPVYFEQTRDGAFAGNGNSYEATHKRAALTSASYIQCGLGLYWDEEEAGWRGTWTRRGNSNIFDARWVRSGYQAVDNVLRINASGNRVMIQRWDPNDSNRTCSYAGTVDSDGISVRGKYTCYYQGRATFGPADWGAVIRCSTPEVGVSIENNTNRYGMDYRGFDVPEGSNHEVCRSACARETNCRAYTYVKPGVQGRLARCWLKNGVPGASRSDCCISGVKR